MRKKSFQKQSITSTIKALVLFDSIIYKSLPGSEQNKEEHCYYMKTEEVIYIPNSDY